MNINNVVTILCVALLVFSTYSKYRRAKSARERRFIIWTSIALYVLVGSFIAVLVLFPKTYPMIFIAYLCALFGGISYLNRQQSKIQREEQTR
jgi:hypothetical protein